MHREAQNLVAGCSNCLSLVVRFHANTRQKNGCAPENFSLLKNKPYHTTFVEIKDGVQLKSRHDKKSRADRHRVFQNSDHEVRNFQSFYQASANLIAAKRAGDAARRA